LAWKISCGCPQISILAWSHTSDFFLFRRVNHGLQTMTFPSNEELRAAIREMVAAITKKIYRECLITGWRDMNQFSV
jgi:hypothetical protein